MFGAFKKKARIEEPLEPADVNAVSPLLVPPDLPEEEKIAIQAKNTILEEQVAMARSTASGAGTSGGFGAFQPFLSEKELRERETPESWQHDEAPETDAPQR
jgi:hypothetical protein